MLRKNIGIFYVILFAILNITFFQNCSNFKDANDPSNSGDGTIPTSFDGYTYVSHSVLESTAMAILSQKCIQCHGAGGAGGFSSFDKIDFMVAAGYVLPSNDLGSPIYDAIQKKRMPEDAPLSTAEVKTISDWILQLKPIPTTITGGGGGKTPTPVPTIFPSPTPLVDVTFVTNSALEKQGLTLITQKCNSCHAVNIRAGNVYDVTNIDYMIVKGMLHPGYADNSPLFASVVAGRMPLSSYFSAAQMQTMRNWINGMQMVAAPGHVVPVPTPMAAIEATFKSLSEHVLLPKCAYCHGSKSAARGLRFDSYNATKVSVVAGLPNESALYRACNGGGMPQPPSKMDANEINIMKQWIEEGALNN